MTKENKTKERKTKNPTNATWTVRGVTPETREACKQAARRSGKSMGAWLNDTLHKAAVEEITGQNTLPDKRLEDQLAEISGKLDAMQLPFWQQIFRR